MVYIRQNNEMSAITRIQRFLKIETNMSSLGQSNCTQAVNSQESRPVLSLSNKIVFPWTKGHKIMSLSAAFKL